MMIRTYCDQDWKELFKLYNRIYRMDRVTEEFFITYLLMDPNFESKGLFIAEDNGKITGWAMAQIMRNDFDVWGKQSLRSKGTGFLMPPITEDLETCKLLIRKAEEYLKSEGCSCCRGAAAGYTLFPDGVDPVTNPVVHQAFEELGYGVYIYSHSMGRRLDNYSIPEKIQEKTAILEKEGYVAKVCDYEDLPALRHFLAEGDLKYWMHLPLRKAQQNLLHESIVVRKGADAVGYCQYNYFGEIERIGPFGVAESVRGKGIGVIMIAKLLDIMAERGFRYGYFAACLAELIPFYSQNGLEVYRKKTTFTKSL